MQREKVTHLQVMELNAVCHGILGFSKVMPKGHFLMADLELKGQDRGNRVRWLQSHVSQQWVFMLEILIKSMFKFS